MHQTFYIDIDEEITSIVDRLKKSKAPEIIIVVPKRALLIQSIVNLKLLKKEADRFGKQLVIVTQDKLGKLLVEKAQIPVQQKLDEIDSEEIIISDEAYLITDDSAIVENYNRSSDKKIEEIGSADYFEQKPKVKKIAVTTNEKKKTAKKSEKIINTELVSGIREKVKISGKKATALDIVKRKKVNLEPSDKQKIEKQIQKYKKQELKADENDADFFDKKQEDFFDQQNLDKKKIEDFFKNKKKNDIYNETEDYQAVEVSGKFLKIFIKSPTPLFFSKPESYIKYFFDSNPVPNLNFFC